MLRVASQRPGRAVRWGHRRLRRDAEPVNPREQLPHEPPLTAERPFTPRNVQEKPIRRIGCNEWRESVRPHREFPEGGLVPAWVVILNVCAGRRQQRTCVCQSHSRPHARRTGLRAARRDDLSLRHPVRENNRLRRLYRPRT